MTRGTLLWLRHQHVPQCLAVSVVATVLLRLLIAQSFDSTIIDVAPVWLSAATTIPLLFMFTQETDVERIAPTSLAVRRITLTLIALCTASLLSLLAGVGGGAGVDAVACWRDCVALLGLGLVGLALMDRAAIWLLPTLAAMMSVVFAWPLQPTLSDGIWAALRAPVGWHFPHDNTVNLSVAVCLMLGGVGVATYLQGIRACLTASVGVHGSSRTAPRGWRAGVRRVFLQTPLLAGTALFVLLALLANRSRWGGSPRLLVANALPGLFFFIVPVGTVVGLVIGQARWRSGVATWQTLSPRPQL